MAALRFVGSDDGEECRATIHERLVPDLVDRNKTHAATMETATIVNTCFKSATCMVRGEQSATNQLGLPP